MDEFAVQLNHLLVDTFRCILKVEEQTLRGVGGMDLSISELHLIESVGKGKDAGSTISGIAEDLDITLPSVTVAINKLAAKGFVEKVRGEADSRTVYVKLTHAGRKADAAHRYFHENMVRSVVSEMDEAEKKTLLKGTRKLNEFFRRKLRPAEA